MRVPVPWPFSFLVNFKPEETRSRKRAGLDSFLCASIHFRAVRLTFGHFDLLLTYFASSVIVLSYYLYFNAFEINLILLQRLRIFGTNFGGIQSINQSINQSFVCPFFLFDVNVKEFDCCNAIST